MNESFYQELHGLDLEEWLQVGQDTAMLTVSKKSLCLLIRKYKQTGSVANKKATRQPTKLVDVHYQFIDAAMANNDEK